MEQQMFCYQCEQTAGCSGCVGNIGVCGKSADVANLQDKLTGALIGLARATEGKTTGEQGLRAETFRMITEGLFATITNVSFDAEAIQNMIDKMEKEKNRLSPGCSACGTPCGKTNDYTLHNLWQAEEDIRSLKSLILFGIRGMAAYAYHALMLGYTDEEINLFFCEALYKIGYEETKEELLHTVLRVGEINLKCMALLDRANTESYGTPEPVTVPLCVEKGPFIVVTGHDLKDLKMLLEQTEGKGVNIYTHGEMLPAHAYPELKKYKHLKGNYGTAWQNQQREFEDIPAPILFTTNCIMPLRASYADRVFTTSVVAYPGVPHIDEGRDFSPVIEKALELGGYAQDTLLPGLNGGSTVTTGFARTAVLQPADEIVQAVRDGKLRHFFLVGGCDGTRPSRRYYTEFARLTPPDTILLTLACGKFRLNDLPLGTVPGTGLPRILDVGQCNDAYSAIRIALALADAFGCGVNDLPLSLVLCWFEQKAVCILIALLALGIRNIRLGPTLPPFLSPGVVHTLQERYGLKPIATPEADLRAILGG